MTIEADRASSGRTSRRIYALWAIGLSAILVLGIACWLLVVPLMRARDVMGEVASSGVVPDNAIDRLGGQRKAAFAIGLYLRMPGNLAPHRSEACYVLSHCGKHMIPTLRRALTDSDPRCRKVAISLATHVAPAASELWPSFVKLLGDGNPEIRARTAEALARLAPPRGNTRAAPWQSRFVWRYSYDRIGVRKGIRVPEFPPFECVRPKPLEREAVKSVVIALAGSLLDYDSDVREAALAALSRYGEAAAPAVPALAKLLDAPKTKLRVNALAVLASIGSRASKATPSVLKCLSDESEDVRVNAVVVLFRTVPDRRRLKDMLKPALGDPSSKVRELAEEVLSDGFRKRGAK